MKNETVLIGLDIYKYVKSLCNKFSHMGETPDMTENECKAYRSGVNVALSLLDQALNEMFVNEEDGVIIHVPNLTIAEEFYSVDEIVEIMKEV